MSAVMGSFESDGQLGMAGVRLVERTESGSLIAMGHIGIPTRTCGGPSQVLSSRVLGSDIAPAPKSRVGYGGRV